MYRLTDYAPGPPQGREIIVDLFAGGGGASEGIRMALAGANCAAMAQEQQAPASAG